jgi:hypothetical protein
VCKCVDVRMHIHRLDLGYLCVLKFERVCARVLMCGSVHMYMFE